MTSTIKYDQPATYNPHQGYPWSADNQLLSWINPGARVLELGCATGYMGRYLHDTKNCHLVGIDAHQESLEKARPSYDRVLCADLDHLEKINLEGESFDVILCAAVLEHLKDPVRLINFLKPRLKSGGTFIISLPNIAHWSIRWKLFFGNFTYSDYGILDFTHLHFYTYKSSQELMDRAGLKIKRISIDPDAGLPLFNGLIRRLPGGWSFLKFLYNLFPNFFGYQILLEAFPR